MGFLYFIVLYTKKKKKIKQNKISLLFRKQILIYFRTL